MFLFKFTLFSGMGGFVGTYLVKFVSQKNLKKVFAIFLIFMGVFILYKNKETLTGGYVKKSVQSEMVLTSKEA